MANTNQLNNEILAGLSPEEREIVLKTLQEISKGDTKTFDDLRYADYSEIPTDIETFVDDNNYLGNAWHDAEGHTKLYPYWRRELKKIFPNNLDTAVNNAIFSGSRGRGKAQPLSTPVLSSKGFVPMGEIKLGDQVYGRDGNLHTVVGVFPQGLKDIYRISFTDGTSTLCCKEHLWEIHDKADAYRAKKYNVARRVQPLEWLLDKKLKRQKKDGSWERNYFIPMCDPIQFPEVELPIHPYILGCLLGDGHIGQRLVLTTADSEIVDRIRLILKAQTPEYDLCFIPSSKYDYCLKQKSPGHVWSKKCHLKVPTANQYRQACEKLGINKNSRDKFIPDLYKFSDVQSRIELLQGLMDTDGTVSSSGSVVSFSTISPYLRDDVIWLVQSLGGTAWYGERHPFYRNSEGVRVAGQTCFEVLLKLPKTINPFYLSRKRDKLKQNRNNPSRYIDNIECVGKEECQCILIDSEEHLYLTNDFIVTHNSEVSILVAAYLLHRILCLKNPIEHFHLKPSEKIVFAFMNIKLALAEEIGVSKFQNTIQSSPWFLAHGELEGRTKKIWVPKKYNDQVAIDIKIGSQSDDLIGLPIYFAFFDEVSFQRNQDVDKQKQKANDMIDTAIGGMKTRFVHQGKNPTLLVLASSKRSDKSFLEEHMKKKLKSEKDNVYISDGPVWEVKPPETYSLPHFKVALGNKFLQSQVIPDDDNLSVYIDKGYKILDVPGEFKADFLDDIDRALCDFAGISSSEISKYISGSAWTQTRNDKLQNLFTRDLIEVGNDPDDAIQYRDYIDMSRVNSEMMSRPLFVHLDMSVSGDMTGIAGVWIKRKDVHKEGQNQSNELHFQLAFSVSVKAPKGRQISFEKNRQFIYWLKSMGFNLKGISTDTFQSVDTGQSLVAKGYNYSVLSVDRVDPSSHICLPYQYFRSCIYEKRIETYESDTLTAEVIDLERNINTGKVDHPEGGRKDVCDAVCGATFNASKHAEEFAFDFGETLEDMINVSTSADDSQMRQQIQVDFEEELAKITMPDSIKKQQEKDRDAFMDFGNGPAQTPSVPLIGDGMIIW